MAKAPSLVTRKKEAPKKSGGFWESQRLAKHRSHKRKAKSKKVSLDDLAMFTQQLASMLDAGLPLVGALDAIKDQLENPVFRIIVVNIRNDISAGSSFSETLRQYPNAFPNIFVSMVEAGEASGALAEIMAKVATYFSDSSQLVKKVRSALTYPAVVIGIAIILVNVLLVFVIPVFAEMFSSFGAELPTPTKILMGISDFLKSYIFYLLIGAVLLWKITGKVVKTPKGRAAKDRIYSHIPIVGLLVKKISLSRFCRTYAILLRSGVPILRSIEICSTASDNVYIEEACIEIIRHISQGGQISEILSQNEYFPPMVAHMAKAGEETGNVEDMMNKIADFYDVEISNTVATLTSLLEPALIVFLGLVVGSIVMAMFLPIFELSSVFGE